MPLYVHVVFSCLQRISLALFEHHVPTVHNSVTTTSTWHVRQACIIPPCCSAGHARQVTANILYIVHIHCQGSLCAMLTVHEILEHAVWSGANCCSVALHRQCGGRLRCLDSPWVIPVSLAGEAQLDRRCSSSSQPCSLTLQPVTARPCPGAGRQYNRLRPAQLSRPAPTLLVWLIRPVPLCRVRANKMLGLSLWSGIWSFQHSTSVAASLWI